MMTLIPWYYRWTGIIALMAAFGGLCWLQGADHVQRRADIEQAKREAAVAQQQQQIKESNDAVKSKIQADAAVAISKAGRAAVVAYVSSVWMLSPASCHQQAVSSSGVDAAPGESGTSERLADFANRCARDALTVLQWQEWATGQGLKTE